MVSIDNRLGLPILTHTFFFGDEKVPFVLPVQTTDNISKHRIHPKQASHAPQQTGRHTKKGLFIMFVFFSEIPKFKIYGLGLLPNGQKKLFVCAHTKYN